MGHKLFSHGANNTRGPDKRRGIGFHWWNISGVLMGSRSFKDTWSSSVCPRNQSAGVTECVKVIRQWLASLDWFSSGCLCRPFLKVLKVLFLKKRKTDFYFVFLFLRVLISEHVPPVQPVPPTLSGSNKDKHRVDKWKYQAETLAANILLLELIQRGICGRMKY